MGVSFKVARTGTRYRPKPGLEDNLDSEDGGPVADTQQRLHQGNYSGEGDKVTDQASVSVKSGVHLVSEDLEVSFSLNLFPNGFSVGKTTELFSDIPKLLHPYDRASETLFTAIEYGWLPGDIFDGLSCKYVNGAILCEIRDYRNCYKRADTASAVNSPIVHKVSLQMCMENVIKDIISISNDSWTYKDLLEVESCILKALQPVLCLNPEPLIDGFGRGPVTKKLDLGLSWSWKKKKINDETTSKPRFSKQCDRGVPSSQLTISSSILNLQKNNIVSESVSQPNLLTMQPSYQLAERCRQSVPIDSRLSHLTSGAEQHISEHNHDPREPSSLVSPEQGTCETQANKRPILKMPKEEPVDFSQQQAAVSQSENTLAAEPLKMNTSLHQKAEKSLHERVHGKRGLSVFRNNCQQTIFEGNGKLQAGMLASAVKQEPVETSDCLGVNVKSIKDKYLNKDVKGNQTNLQQLHLQQSSSILGTSIASTNTRRDQMVYDKNARNQVGGQKRKALQNPQVTAGMRIISSHQNDSLPSEVSVPAKRKKSSHLKVSSSLSGDLLAVTSNGNTISYFQLQNSDLPQTSEVKADPLLERFVKIMAVAQRHGLSNRKCKLDRTLSDKLDFSDTTRVEYHLLNPVENWKLKDATTARIPLSECFVDRKLNESKMRTLVYVHQSRINQGLQIPMVDSNAHVKLVMSEILNEGFVEASVLYGHKTGIASTRFHILPIFGSTHSADRFAAQFTSLIVREGYCLVHEKIESTPFHGDGCSSTQVVTVADRVPSAPGAIELPSSTLTPGPSTSFFTPETESIQPINCRKLISWNLLSEGHSLPSGNIQSRQLSRSNLPKVQLGITTQVSPVQHWLQSLNKQAQLQFQMMQIQRQQNQIMQRMTMMGSLGAATVGPGMVQYGEGIQGHRNIGHGSLSDIMSIGGSVQVPRGGKFPWIHNASQSNNIGSNIPSSSGSKQSFGGITDNAFQVLATGTANNQGRDLMGGYPFQRNASSVPMQTPSIQDMAYLLTNQQILPHIQRMRPVIQPKVENSLLNDYIGNTSIMSMNCSPPPGQVNAELLNYLLQMNQVQASSGTVIPQRNNRNIVFSPGSPQESSRTRGSVGSSNVSSSRTLSAFSKNKGAVKTERE